MHENPGSPIDRSHGGTVSPILGLLQKSVWDIDRHMNMHVSKIQEKRARSVVPDKSHGFFDIALGERGLIRLLLNHLLIPHER